MLSKLISTLKTLAILVLLPGAMFQYWQVYQGLSELSENIHSVAGVVQWMDR